MDGNIALLLFQIFKSLLGGWSHNALLNGIKKIINTSLNVSVLFSEHRQNSILFTLDFHYGIGNLFKKNIIKKHFFNLLYNKILYPIFLYGFLIATAVFFYTNAFVITIHR